MQVKDAMSRASGCQSHFNAKLDAKNPRCNLYLGKANRSSDGGHAPSGVHDEAQEDHLQVEWQISGGLSAIFR